MRRFHPFGPRLSGDRPRTARRHAESRRSLIHRLFGLRHFRLGLGFAVLVAIGIVSYPAIAHAESAGNDPIARWDDRFFLPGLDGSVRAIVSWRGLLVAGGEFQYADGRRAPGLAAWNGIGWATFDTTEAGPVRAATVWHDQLVVARPADNEASEVASWDGLRWTPLAPVPGATNVLFACGDSLLAGGSTVYLWTGSQWRRFLPNADFDGPILALAKLRGDLYVAGEFLRVTNREFHGVGKFDGQFFGPAGDGIVPASSPGVRALAVSEDHLFVGGLFDVAGQWGSGCIARLEDGQWTDLGGGFSRVDALWTGDGEVLACGAATDKKSVRVARWHDGSWTDLTPPERALQDNGADRRDRLRLAVHEGRIFLGGGFRTWEGTAVTALAVLDPTGWSPLEERSGLGLDGAIRVLTPWSGGLIVAGDFDRAGDTAARHVAYFDGQRWQAMGEGLSGRVLDVVATDEGPARSVSGTGTGLYADWIRVWTGSSWTDVSVALGLAAGAPSIATYHGDLVAAGRFQPPGALAALSGIARRHGGQWGPIADEGWSASPSLYNVDGDLLAFGTYRGAAGPSGEFRRWNGRAWIDPVPAPPHPPYRVARWRDRLIVLSWFTEIHGDVYQDRTEVWSWEGGQWSRLGTDETWGNDLASFADTLYLASRSSSCLFRWTGTSWAGVPGAPSSRPGAYASCERLTRFAGGLWVGGAFHQAGAEPAANLARYESRATPATSQGEVQVWAEPNPFPTTTAVIFDLPGTAPTQVTIHDVVGRTIRTLWDGLAGPGTRSVRWDGLDGEGRRLPAGTYWLRVVNSAGAGSSRITIVR